MSLHAKQIVFIDGSKLIIEAIVRSGADVFIGYPITPANNLFLYASQRFPVALSAPDEISTLQWMSGYAAAGKLTVTATSFPGLALMVESINMAVMMELPMVIILAQRLGPATGTATCGAQGDLLLLNGLLSGGFSLPTLSISSFDDCWSLSARAVEWAIDRRSPVVLLTSKEMVMTMKSFDLQCLPPIHPVPRPNFVSEEAYQPYRAGDTLVPEFLPVGNDRHQVRLTASTHDCKGIIQHSGKEAIGNTIRLQKKLEFSLELFTFYEYDEDHGEILVIAWGISAPPAREAVAEMRSKGMKVSLLIPKTILPIPSRYLEIIRKYQKIVIVEENLTGQLRQLLFGAAGSSKVSGVNAIGRMISPDEIIIEVKKNEQPIREHHRVALL